MDTDACRARAGGRLHRMGPGLLLLSAFLALFTFLFVEFRSAALQTVTKANDSFVNYVDTVLQLSNTNIRTSAMQMFYTSSIRALRTSAAPTWSERVIGQRDLGNFASSSSFIDNVMVYNQNCGMVFTSESSYGAASAAEFHDQDAVDILLHPENHAYLTPFKRQSGASTYYSFLFSEDSSAGFSAMLLDINAVWYEKQLLGSLSTDSHMIVDGEGKAVIPSEPSVELLDWSLFRQAFEANPYSGYVLPPGSSFSLSTCWVYHRLGTTGWYCLEVFDLESVAPGLVHIQHVVLVLFVLMGLVLAVLLTYLTVYALIPYLHIRRALQTANLEGQDPAEQVSRLLSSHHAYESSRRLQELQAGVFPEGLDLPVVLLSVSGTADALYDRILTWGGEALPAQADQEQFLILPACASESRNRLLASLREQAPAARPLVSLPCYSGEQLQEAFAAFEELRQLAFLYPSQPVLCQELLAECNAPSGFRPEVMTSVSAALKKGQLEVAQAKWLLLFNEIRRDRYRDFRFAVYYVDKALAALEEEYGLEPEMPLEGCLDSLAALQGHIDSRLRAIAGAVTASQQEMADSLSSAVWSKIYQLYQDENCCSQMIAEQLDMSQSYLNRQFRKAAGMSVNDAVQHVRIDRVCALLRESALPVEQIARQAGYSNTKYFFVLFKKYTGKTPSQFRSELS